jgi:hypothetical protein
MQALQFVMQEELQMITMWLRGNLVSHWYDCRYTNICTRDCFDACKCGRLVRHHNLWTIQRELYPKVYWHIN